ncbi:hypothetical protein PQR71_07755 [Paraburkholderia fungorum]|uniref:hypothetical protein n=1 Tax=Paraburkholderia fungorum TaxID=134537 RepID=UPI0038B6E53A
MKNRATSHGYAWRRQLLKADLDIWCHRDPPEQNPCLDIETIEAEVVYLIRQAGQWPRFQTEIHFHESNEEHRRCASVVIEKYDLTPLAVGLPVPNLSMESQ